MQIQSYFFLPSVYEFPCSFPFPVVHTSTLILNKSEENRPDTLTLNGGDSVSPVSTTSALGSSSFLLPYLSLGDCSSS